MSFTVNLSPLPLRSPETTTGINKPPKPITSFTRKKPILSFAITNSTEQPQTTTPEIELQFIGPKAGSDGKYPVDRATAVSGEKLLRNIMKDNKLELYGTWELVQRVNPQVELALSLTTNISLRKMQGVRRREGNPQVEVADSPSHQPAMCNLVPSLLGKLMNCGGGGSCGTCIVEVVEGKELLNERTNTELKYLKKKPESWRLACQTIVGNKENSGKVVIQRLPQQKK